MDPVRRLARNGVLFFEAGPGAVLYLYRTARWIDQGIETYRLDGKREVEAVPARVAGKRD